MDACQLTEPPVCGLWNLSEGDRRGIWRVLSLVHRAVVERIMFSDEFFQGVACVGPTW